MNVDCPEQELIHAQWETALEEIGWAFFKWNSAECLSSGSIIPPELNWPSLIRVVCPPGILEWNSQPACWQKGDNTTGKRFERVTISELLR